METLETVGDKLDGAEAAGKEGTQYLHRLCALCILQCALSLMNLGDNYLLWGKLDEAEAAGKEALKISHALKDPEAK